MILKRMGRTGCNQATLKTTFDTSNYTGRTSQNEASITAIIVRLGTCRGSRYDNQIVRAVL